MTVLQVLSPGILTTVQDSGRYHYQDRGIPPSGPMDPMAFRLANALAGNAPDVPALELTVVGGRYRVAGGSCRVAVTGDFPLWLNEAPVGAWRSIDLLDGDELKIGQSVDGCRGYLAIAGGMDISPQLGSCSTLVRAVIGGLDGGPLKRNQQVPLLAEQAPAAPGLSLAACCSPEVMPWYLPGPFRVVLGPQRKSFSEQDVRMFLRGPYQVTAASDRMGYRLSGPRIGHLGGHDMISEPVSAGAIQIPGDGQPIVALCDRQTTGGYPKIATVIRHDLPRLGQCRPGRTLRFRVVPVEQAEALWCEALDTLDAVIRQFDTFDPLGDRYASSIQRSQ